MVQCRHTTLNTGDPNLIIKGCALASNQLYQVNKFISCSSIHRFIAESVTCVNLEETRAGRRSYKGEVQGIGSGREGREGGWTPWAYRSDKI